MGSRDRVARETGCVAADGRRTGVGEGGGGGGGVGPLLAPFDTTCVGRLSRERSKTGPASANPRIGPFNARRVFAIINIRDTGNPGPRGRLDSLNETVADVHRTGRRRRKGCIKNGTAKQPVSPERFREEFLKGVGMDRFSVIILEIGKRNGKRFFDITRQRHMLVYIYIRISSGKDSVIRLSSRIPRFSRKVCSSSSLSPPRGDKSSVRESEKDTKSAAFPGLEFPSLGIRNRSIFSARSTRTQPAHF